MAFERSHTRAVCKKRRNKATDERAVMGQEIKCGEVRKRTRARTLWEGYRIEFQLKRETGVEREREGESERRVAVKVQVDGRTAREGEVGKGYYHATVCLYRLAF